MTDEQMTDEQMTAEQFSDLISAYGGAADRWPETQRAAMLAFSQSHPEAQAIRGREASLDSWLARRLDAAPQALSERIEAVMIDALASQQPANSANILFAHNEAIVGLSRRHYASVSAAAAACLVGGFIMAPQLLELFIISPDIMASLEVFSDELFLN